MPKFMVPLVRITKHRIPKIASQSTAKLFGKTQPKFYRAMGKHILAVGSTPKDKHTAIVTIAKFNEEKMAFEPFVKNHGINAMATL